MASNYAFTKSLPEFTESLPEISTEDTCFDPTSTTANRASVDASHHDSSNVSSLLDFSLHDLFELSGDFVAELCGSTNEIIDKDIIHTSSSSSTTPMGNTTTRSFWNNDVDDAQGGDIDIALLGNNFNGGAESQQSSPVSMPEPTQSQSPFDFPPTRFYSSYDLDYYGYLKTLVPGMETSEQSRSKVRMLLIQQQQQERIYASKLADTGLNTTKSEETRNMLLQAYFGQTGNSR